MTITEREAKDAGIDVENMQTDSMTTLQAFCRVFGWQGGTVHDAKRRAAVASPEEMDRLCTLLAREIHNITDPATAGEFLRMRREAIRLHMIAMDA
jgi:hypothetical protein